LPTITVTIIGEALGRRYIERDNDYLYTGAQLSGEVQLTTATGEVYRRPFTSLTSMPFKFSTVNLGYDQPANAPFAETLAKTGGMANALAEVIIAAWGVEAILPVLVDGDDTARADVANLLGDLGTSDAVTALIEALELDDNAVVRQRAAWSLGRTCDPVVDRSSRRPVGRRALVRRLVAQNHHRPGHGHRPRGLVRLVGGERRRRRRLNPTRSNGLLSCQVIVGRKRVGLDHVQIVVDGDALVDAGNAVG